MLDHLKIFTCMSNQQMYTYFVGVDLTNFKIVNGMKGQASNCAPNCAPTFVGVDLVSLFENLILKSSLQMCTHFVELWGYTSEEEIMVELGNQVPRKKLTSQKVFCNFKNISLFQ